MAFNSPPNKIQVKSATLVTPPGSPAAGDVYLLFAGTPTGAWAGQLGKFARWNGSAWEFIIGFDGCLVWTKDTSKIYHYNGTDWKLSSRDLSFSGDVISEGGNNRVVKIQNIPVHDYNSTIISDNFDDNSLSSMLEKIAPSSGISIIETNGRIEITPDGSNNSNGLNLSNLQNLNNKYIQIELIQPCLTAGIDTFFGLVDNPNNNYYLFQYRDGLLRSFVYYSGSVYYPSSVTYNSTAHRFLRIGYTLSTNTCYWQVSPDGINWTTVGTNTGNSFPFNNCQLRIIQLNNNGVSSSSKIIIDNFRTNIEIAGDALADGAVMTYNAAEEEWQAILPSGGIGITQSSELQGVDSEPKTKNSFDDEFEGTFLKSVWTKTSSGVLTESYNDKVRSGLFVRLNPGGSYNLSKPFVPGATDFSMTVCYSMEGYENFNLLNFMFSDGVNNDMQFLLAFNSAPRFTIHKTQSGSVTYDINYIGINLLNYPKIYVHVQRTAANLWSMWYSNNGINWLQLMDNYSYAVTVNNISLDFNTAGGTTKKINGVFHWIRRDWLVL